MTTDQTRNGTWNVDISSDSMSATELLSRLEGVIDPEADYAFQIKKPRLQFRAVDAAVLVALIGAAGSTLTALVAGLLQIYQRKAEQRISIEFSSGTKLQIPANVSAADLHRILEPISEPARKIIVP